ncbi:MAG TPA: protein kinase, partial [Polyangiaceae bacterium]|nr:protein kinase [Polyangiaceae bacterium]
MLRNLGGGATSRVLLVEREQEKLVAKLGRDVGQRLRFADEAERLCLVDSPWVAPVLDVSALERETTLFGERFERGVPVLLFPWEEGETLADAASPADAKRRLELAALVARDIGAALADLHAVGSAHGDIKPQNIIVSAAGARLIDFGLSGEASAETASGGTRRYLAPEALSGQATGDARRRDLYALGVVLAELLEPGFAGEHRLASSAELLAEVARALLEPAPSARPSATWVARRAQVAGQGRGRTEAPESAVRRAYRFSRRRELFDAARSGKVELRLGPLAGGYLRPVLEMLAKIRSLRGQGASAASVQLLDLDPLGQARFLVSLVGVSASAWPRLPVESDQDLLERACRATAQRAPAALRFLDFEAGSRRAAVAFEGAQPPDPLTLVLALRDPAVSDATLETAEQLLRGQGAPLPLRLELARVLRLRGELGRACSLLAAEGEPEARLELAEIWRRAGEPARMQLLLDQLGSATPELLSRAAALRARVAIDAEQLDEAERLLAGQVDTPQSA